MKTIFLNYCSVIVTFSFAIVLSAQGQTNVVHYQRTIALLNNIEREMDKHYVQIEKKRLFEDPLGRIDFWFKTVHSQAPELFMNTREYKKDLISCLMDSTIKKNIYKFGYNLYFIQFTN